MARRRALLAGLRGPALLSAGLPPSRNYRANRYPFRAASHFLYFVGRPIPGAALLFDGDATTLFVEAPDPDDALWHGPRPSLDEVRRATQVDHVLPLTSIDQVLRKATGGVATLPTQDDASAEWLSVRLQRPIAPRTGDKLSAGSDDEKLADQMISLRLRHDAAARAQLAFAARVSAEAHRAGMVATRKASTEAEVAAAMVAVLRAHCMEDAYGPIVTVSGEVLHNDAHDARLAPGDLLLADVGGETPEGWAADITRTWPVTGRFSASQRAIYEVVLAAQLAAIDRVRPGVRYREVHETAKRVIVSGLKDLGVFRGDVDGLLERGAAAVFFPHGIGHLLGLDVHDMEDLGDRAGYAEGRTRSSNFGDGFLRLDRDLAPGMAVTVEPGFYQVPAILSDPRFTEALGADFVRDNLARFADVRGIRIEDDVLVTDGDPLVLTGGAPKQPDEIEKLMLEGAASAA